VLEDLLDRVATGTIAHRPALERLPVVDLHRIPIEEPEEVPRVLVGVGEGNRAVRAAPHFAEDALEAHDHVRLGTHLPFAVFEAHRSVRLHNTLPSRCTTRSGLPIIVIGNRDTRALVVTRRSASMTAAPA
jgi:hypothetical protein